jgi:hypothetical protein
VLRTAANWKLPTGNGLWRIGARPYNGVGIGAYSIGGGSTLTEGFPIYPTADAAEPTIGQLAYAKRVLPAPGIELLEPEAPWKRYAYGAIALLLAVSFYCAVMSYWVPAHGGTDQNGYLVGGKMFAENLTMRQSPIHPGSRDEFDPHQFIGRMWVGAGLGTPDERYYPKYPLGLPALYAALIWISALFGPAWTIWLTYGLSPVAMSLAVLGTYLLARGFAGSFGGLLTAIVFATSPVSLQLAINPNSHAAAVCCVVWGMYFLIGWWQYRGAMRAITAGFLLGYAATIRYSEGTLILPISLVALFALRWRDWKSLSQAAALLVAWAVPVGLLLIYNHFAMGDLTGYDPTNESTGFMLGYAMDNWETMLRQINTNGLAQLFPLAMAGLVWMFWWNWRAASVLAAWIIPCLLIYTFYYWAPDGTSIGYLRFFTTILPGLALCFFWLMSRLNAWAMRHHETDTLHALPTAISICCGVLVMIGVGLALDRAWKLEHDPSADTNHPSWIAKYIRLSTADADADTDTHHDAAIQFDADRLGALAAGVAGALIALALVRGRVVVPAAGAGLFTGVVIAMHLTNAIPFLEADQAGRYQIALRAEAIREAIPDGSIIFCPDQDVLDNLQFAGDYVLYDGMSFRRDWVQALPNVESADQPQGLDPGRRDALFNRLKDFTQPQLDDQARRIMRDALAANRRVFFVINTRPDTPIPKKVRRAMGLVGKEKRERMNDVIARLCPPDRFATDVISVWPGYVPGLAAPKVNKPRGLRPTILPDAKAARQAIQMIEVTPAVAGSAKG